MKKTKNLKDWFLSRTLFEYLSYFFLLAGLAIFLIAIADYKYPQTLAFLDFDKIDSLGTLLSGTSGILWALAGVLLFFSALKYQRQDLILQREEMTETRKVLKEQSDTLKIQTAESTYFRLLDNHRSLISSLSFAEDVGYKGLAKFYIKLKKDTEIYYQSAHLRKIVKSIHGTYYPLTQLKHQRENIEQIYCNIYHLISFITVKLNNDLFYHETLYHTLSTGEKYILGLYVLNEKAENSKFFHDHGFNYLKEFEGSGNAAYLKEKDPYFPYLTYTFISPLIKFNTKDFLAGKLDIKGGDIQIATFENINGCAVILKNIKIQYNWKGKDHIYRDTGNIVLDPKQIVNVFNFFQKHVLNKFYEMWEPKRESIMFTFAFSIIFEIECGGNNFEYTKRFQCDPRNFSQNGFDVGITEGAFESTP